MKHIKIKLPQKKNLKNFFYNLNLKFFVDETIKPSFYNLRKKILLGVMDSRQNPNPHPPDLKDLSFKPIFIALLAILLNDFDNSCVYASG